MKANIPALGLAAAGLAACGGGLLAVLQIVTPLGGFWSSGTTSIQFTNLNPASQAYLTRFDVTADVQSPDGLCGPAAVNSVVGTVDNGELVLRPPAPANAANCIEGTFTDLRKLDTVALGGRPARSYTNGLVDVQLQEGVWVSESGTLALKFNEPSSVLNSPATRLVTGCNVSIPANPVGFAGQMEGFNEVTLRRPFIPELVNPLNNAQKYFTQVEFVDGATLRLINAGGQLVTLKRRPGNQAC